jgi:hypothetical protein
MNPTAAATAFLASDATTTQDTALVDLPTIDISSAECFAGIPREHAMPGVRRRRVRDGERP